MYRAGPPEDATPYGLRQARRLEADRRRETTRFSALVSGVGPSLHSRHVVFSVSPPASRGMSLVSLAWYGLRAVTSNRGVVTATYFPFTRTVGSTPQ